MKWWSKKQLRVPKLMQGQSGYAFRRSRTLTGSTSEKVAPSAESSGQLKTARLKNHEHRARFKYFAKVLAVWLALAGLVTFLVAMYIREPNIGFVGSSHSQPDKIAYQSTIKNYMAKNPLQHFSFSVMPRGANEFIKSNHPEVDNVVISRNWYGGDVLFEVIFRKPLIMWQLGDESFYVDSEGEAFKFNNYDPPQLVVSDKSGISPQESGGNVASSRFIKFLGQLVGAVNSHDKGKVVEVQIPASTREIHLKLEGREYVIKTHIDRDPIGQAEDVANALKYFDDKKLKPEYIDVRVENKAYYK